jgi:hypothetical protein
MFDFTDIALLIAPDLTLVVPRSVDLAEPNYQGVGIANPADWVSAAHPTPPTQAEIDNAVLILTGTPPEEDLDILNLDTRLTTVEDLLGSVDVVALQAQVVANSNQIGTNAANIAANLAAIATNSTNIGDNALAIAALQALAHPEASMAEIILAGQTNANGSLAGNTIQLGGINSTISASIPGISLDTTNDTVSLPDGSYIAFLEMSFTSNAQRPNMGVRHLVNSIAFAVKSLGAYIRAASGHNESGGTFIDGFSISSTSDIGFEIFRLSNSGTVNIIGSQSRLIILRVSTQ